MGNNSNSRMEKICTLNANNKHILINMLISELNFLMCKFEKGIIVGSDFQTCTIIVNYINEKLITIVYNMTLNKWNDGSMKENDFEFIICYLKTFI
jgi:hypothetical protein